MLEADAAAVKQKRGAGAAGEGAAHRGADSVATAAPLW